MNLFVDFLIIIVLLIVIGLFIIRSRFRLLKLWKEVSIKEVIFHKLLSDTTNLFFESKELFIGEDYQAIFKKLTKYKKKKLRHLLLKERQDLFQLLNSMYNEIEDLPEEQYIPLKQMFNELQKARRIFNTKVLLYNQTISVFPTRFLAIKLNLQIKEYFG
ncbi:MAG: hypothetical protein JXR62_01375 [Bacilli bacterium]|nr:hypothetical protein [Bacilli bacterium]